MTFDHLTDEQLVELLDGIDVDPGVWAIYGEEETAIRTEGMNALIAEAARRLRSSIPKPVVEVNGTNGNYDVRINGVMFAWYSLDSWGSDLDARAAAIAKRDQFIKALGLEGGGDE